MPAKLKGFFFWQPTTPQTYSRIVRKKTKPNSYVCYIKTFFQLERFFILQLKSLTKLFTLKRGRRNVDGETAQRIGERGEN